MSKTIFIEGLTEEEFKELKHKKVDMESSSWRDFILELAGVKDGS